MHIPAPAIWFNELILLDPKQRILYSNAKFPERVTNHQ
jgi:hypothetical protein